MKSLNASNLLLQIDDAIKDIKSFTSASHLEQAYLAKFLVVYICGIYEEVVETIVNEMVSMIRNNGISNFVKSSLGNNFRNPDTEKIGELLGRFNPTWKAAVRSIPRQNRDALNSIVENKNALAHGQPITVTLAEVYKYHSDAMYVINTIDNLLL
ncbi:MAG: hypothetical protein HYT39_03200 [Candidatus Sungbacteria bacterium]|nr:hypothetical protein [Candidatus Sungbacteria bacterium]